MSNPQITVTLRNGLKAEVQRFKGDRMAPWLWTGVTHDRDGTCATDMWLPGGQWLLDQRPHRRDIVAGLPGQPVVAATQQPIPQPQSTHV